MSTDRPAGAASLVIDAARCAGHGRCYSVAPSLVDCDDDGYPVLLVDVVPPDLLDQAQQAEDSCPERAVAVRR